MPVEGLVSDRTRRVNFALIASPDYIASLSDWNEEPEPQTALTQVGDTSGGDVPRLYFTIGHSHSWHSKYAAAQGLNERIVDTDGKDGIPAHGMVQRLHQSLPLPQTCFDRSRIDAAPSQA